jgi:hypothetical protein
MPIVSTNNKRSSLMFVFEALILVWSKNVGASKQTSMPKTHSNLASGNETLRLSMLDKLFDERGLESFNYIVAVLVVAVAI